MTTDRERIEQLEKENRELRIKLREAAEANTAKERFLSNMSHDIRTPMNAIVGMTALAKKYIDEKPRVIDALNKIDTAGSHLLSLINDVLDMSRINSGRMTISSEKFYLSDLMHDIMTIMRPQFEAKGHEWHLNLKNIEAECFNGDPLRIRQILVNIFGNASKYTPDGGRIDISVSEEEDGGLGKLTFVCRDNGLGMDKEFLKKVFEPFERVSNTTISGIEGTGLGMSIVKKLTEAMGGDINIESEPGKGTEVRIMIPLEIIDEKPETGVLTGRRILVIESDPELLYKYEKILGGSELAYRFVPSAMEAVAALTEADVSDAGYDIAVIGEKRTDSGDFREIASYLKEAHPEITVVLVSSDNWEEIEYKAVRSGISAFIPVPFFRISLINGLAGALSDTAAVESAYPDLNGKRILLAEDNLVNREIAKEILSVTGAVIDTAENGREAVDMFTGSPENHYDLILMDVQMPVMDGYTATGLIRNSGRADSGVPVFAMTANTFAEDIKKAGEAGMDGHIAKPVDMNALFRTIKNVIR